MLLNLVLCAAAIVGAAAKLSTVRLDRATVVGTSDGVVTQFLGIPFAEPPYVPHPLASRAALILSFVRQGRKATAAAPAAH